ncbi:aspartic peptidase domain-containing protein [Irpex rosettiformis]|uniref:Aspartic peptidase domain-containing protein n=1 Tax=Irpex rosettiformis TaxID=378272 RepID=A0ACB8UBN6_9APHY|nr:aspartic peptidase domain-containing protein [Irpex rosettiformis]
MPRHMRMKSYSASHHKLKINENIENARDVVYATNITLGGQQFPIQLDTGSSDVWVQLPPGVKVSNTTNLTSQLTFGIGEVEGNIAFADMQLGPHNVPAQAFLNATNATNFNAIFKNGILGIMGLAFDIGSSNFATLVGANGPNDTSGLTFLSNIFVQNKTAPNLFTVLLGRDYDKDGPQEGAFTISEYVDGLEKISNEPKLFRTPAQIKNVTTLPRWSVQLDSMTVNGTKFKFNQSSVPEADPGKQVVVLDTGFTFSQMPPAAVDFIYSQMPGSFFNQTSGFWVVPCNATIPLSFEFGGKTFPVHPLDVTTTANLGNETVCVNSYRAINLPPGAAAGFDFILGDTFLKNVYTSFDYGDFIPNSEDSGVPFVQLLATTDPKTALHEFKTVRAKQVKQNNEKLNAPQNSTSTVSASASSSTGSTSTVSASSSSSAAAPAASSSSSSSSALSGGMMGMSSYNPSSQSSLKGSGSLFDMFHLSALKRSPSPQVVRGRLVIFRGAMPPPGMPIRFHHKVMNCMNRVANNVHQAMGPAAVALLAGVLGIALISSLVAMVLGVRMLLRLRRGEGVELGEDGYEPVSSEQDDEEKEVVFDAGIALSPAYNHHQHV